ncbi:hypothetical protein C2I36_14625 [Rhodobacteraceae bacterium WD3A24]|nr:hypothetical protein C2I36_14625 [Rhodobacteraceae bacterium WD3A24]
MMASRLDRVADCDDRAIEQAGGWRILMRSAAGGHSVAGCQMSREQIGRHPRVALARAFHLAKTGNPSAARRLFGSCVNAVESVTDADPTLAADRALVDAHISVYEDKALTAADALHLRSVLGMLPDNDLSGQALAFNHLCTVSLHLGDFDKAQEYAEQAIRLFRNDGAEFGSLHLHTHLGQIKMMRGDLQGAEEQFSEMETRLSRLPGNPEWLIAVGRVLRAEVAYETNDLAGAARMMELALPSVEENDAWFDILAAAYRVCTRLAFCEAGLPAALTALSHAECVARERQMPRLHRLMQIERVRALTLSDEMDLAAEKMEEIGLSSKLMTWNETDDWALRQGTAFVAVARWLVRARRAREALEFIGPAEDFAIRGGQLLSLAKLRVTAAAAHWRLHARSAATSSLLSAIRLLGRQPFRRFILDGGREMRAIVQAALDGEHVSVPPTPDQRRRLSELAHYWATDGDAARHRGDPGGAEAQRRRYLKLLAMGHSNKEIARLSGVSVNTVKYHLKRIFHDLRADNRMRAVQRARELDILNDDKLP